MIYQEFKKNVKITIQTWLGSSAKVTIQEIIKNNGTYYDGITIISEQMNVSPTVQLSSYFEQYQEDRSLDANLSRYSQKVRIHGQERFRRVVKRVMKECYVCGRKTRIQYFDFVDGKFVLKEKCLNPCCRRYNKWKLI